MFDRFLSMPVEAAAASCSIKIAILQNALPPTVWFRINVEN